MKYSDFIPLKNKKRHNTIECNKIIKSITYNTKIPKSTKSIISVGMYLCQIHYNQFILNKIRNINCEHPKHNEY